MTTPEAPDSPVTPDVTDGEEADAPEIPDVTGGEEVDAPETPDANGNDADAGDSNNEGDSNICLLYTSRCV